MSATVSINGILFTLYNDVLSNLLDPTLREFTTPYNVYLVVRDIVESNETPEAFDFKARYYTNPLKHIGGKASWKRINNFIAHGPTLFRPLSDRDTWIFLYSMALILKSDTDIFTLPAQENSLIRRRLEINLQHYTSQTYAHYRENMIVFKDNLLKNKVKYCELCPALKVGLAWDLLHNTWPENIGNVHVVYANSNSVLHETAANQNNGLDVMSQLCIDRLQASEL